jgi:thymidylate synthase (FAD)
MGSDLSVVNAARVSFDKQSEWKIEESADGGKTEQLKTTDKRLINYLVAHHHWSPFAHTSISLRISAPIFVARQLVKHQVGGVWNEVSRRYVDSEPEFYIPDIWRAKAENVKQGSSDKEIKFLLHTDTNSGDMWYSEVENSMFLYTDQCLTMYNDLLFAGICPEQARMVLPQNTMTEWIWTGSLAFFHRVWRERTNPHAQKECRDVAELISLTIEPLFPYSWEALTLLKP